MFIFIQKVVTLIAAKGGMILKDKQDETSEGLNQIFEIINAKGDIGELGQIVEKSEDTSSGQTESPTK